ncbi:hypothetical protein TNCV_3345141 [Trichonephila clavipes]|nr:hypothetical protein TNCV_3345141 [Trichonephila clavipes]
MRGGETRTEPVLLRCEDVFPLEEVIESLAEIIFSASLLRIGSREIGLWESANLGFSPAMPLEPLRAEIEEAFFLRTLAVPQRGAVFGFEGSEVFLPYLLSVLSDYSFNFILNSV